MNTYQTGRIYNSRLAKDSDLLEEITKIAEENKIETGIVKAIGAVSRARFGFYDQEEREYRYLTFDKELEIVNLIGNISILNDKPMVHAHIALSDNKGSMFGGHLSDGTIVFSCELYIQELHGNKLVRSYDEETGLKLW